MADIFLNYSLYIFFGILPSFLWLQFYLRKDVHPEPKSMVLKVFFYGMLFTIPASFLETIIFKIVSPLERFYFPNSAIFILNVFLAIALVEEYLKFLIVKQRVLDDSEFDEPVDAMIYMIIAGLGFAAAENILILISAGNQGSVIGGFLRPLDTAFLGEIFGISILRFFGATFLHALASAIVGFFIGLSFFEKKKRNKLISIGLILAVILHGLYNFSITSSNLLSRIFGTIIKPEQLNFLIPFFLLLVSAIFVSFAFKKLKTIAKFDKN